jgi:sorting nexin-1/2
VFFFVYSTKKSSISNSLFSQQLLDEEEENKDKFIEISLSEPTKIGDGMGSYMVYKVTTKTNYPIFKSKEFSANRRFSDFLNLFEKLKEKHLVAGRVLPPAPEKDMIGMAKVKMSKEDSSPIDFIEKRRAALQRFLTRLANHKTFRFDPDFRDFLEIAEDLPKATNTSALSGAGMLKMFKNVTDSVSKIAIKMDETDQVSITILFCFIFPLK